MKLRNSVAAVIIACGLAATGIAGAGAAQAVSPAAAPTVSVRHEAKTADQLSLQQLLDVVADEVRDTFPNATLMVADGSSPSGKTQDMSQVTDWRLVYNTNDSTSRIKSLELHATLEGEIDQPIYHTSPWGGVLPITAEVGLTPEEAYTILQDAGHGDAYQYVALVKPLVAQPHLQYHFSNIRGGCDGYAVNVDDLAVNPICG
ncbi:hypothetical protein SRB5_03140 [Streptomyces sp. RB5]|uniref:Secreted protein n=1 Tax=Streptomyces smaragdinus TaxID=2585196 RepID=A0A7K0C9S0_9ACTN|nr:hypothetical protein [Streptomyces smaragdinus]MQY10207.1 hypothetical protein [Streptomyces smaragdinus]